MIVVQYVPCRLVVKMSRDICSVEVYTVGCDGHFELVGPL